MNEQKRNSRIDILCLGVGEAIFSALICVIYAAKGKFDYTVITGALLGIAVVVFNYIALSASVGRIVDGYIDERGDSEMSDEEAQKFSEKHKMQVQNSITKSYIIRNVVMLAVLVAALVTGFFNPLSLLLPLAMYKPLIYLSELIKKKRGA